MRVVITNEQNFVPVDEAKIKQGLKLLPFWDKKFKLSVVYVDDAEIAKLNERYLKHTGPTDVLSFPISNNEGEIIASGQTAFEEAKAREVEPEGELLLYTVHGLLHLMGYDDHTEEEAAEMHRQEQEIVTKMGYKWDW